MFYNIIHLMERIERVTANESQRPRFFTSYVSVSQIYAISSILFNLCVGFRSCIGLNSDAPLLDNYLVNQHCFDVSNRIGLQGLLISLVFIPLLHMQVSK